MKRTGWAVYIICAALLTQAAGCASLPAKKATEGDAVSLRYFCRLADGSLAASAGIDLLADAALKRSVLHVPRKDAQPAVVSAGAKPKQSNAGFLTMEQEIELRLASGAVGMAEGESGKMELTAWVPIGLTDQDRFLKMSRLRKRAKELKLSREEYTSKSGKEPEPGQRFMIDPLLPGSVAAVSDSEVTIRFAPLAASDVHTPYGTADIRDAGDYYEIEFKVTKGNLVRTGPIAGRISEVDASSFTIDFGNPFAGETLDCDFTLLKVEKPQPQSNSPEAGK